MKSISSGRYASKWLATASLLSAAMVCAPALAQQTRPASDPESSAQTPPETAPPATARPTAAAPRASTEGEIIITGSRIRRDGFTAPTPLTVVSREVIESQSPSNNIADFVNTLPSVAGSLRPANSRLALSSGLAGINALNLRNLGLERTLVLLNGRRSVGSSVTGLVDINTFPQQLVERVEVVTGGASAAYGSDAVAGVVNFVLDTDFEGFRISGDTGITDEGDGFNYSVQASAGTGFADGRGHVLISGQYAHQDGIFSITRDWNQLGYRTIANPDYTNDNGLPQYLVRTMTGTSNALPGGIISSSTGTVPDSLRGIYFGPGGSVNQYDYGDLTSGSLTSGGDWALADNSRRIGLAAEDDRRGVFGRVSFELSPAIELFGEASYYWQETLFNAGPQFTTNILLQPDNAFLINALGADALDGVTGVRLGTTSGDLPVRGTNNQRDTQRYLIGAQGDFELFGSDASWNAYAQYGQTNTREQLLNIQDTSNVALATDAVFAPEGNAAGIAPGTIVCRSTLSDPGNGCVPFNRLGINNPDVAVLDYIFGNPYRDQKLEQTVAGLDLSFSPFSTWAGAVDIAVGGEYRKEEVSGFVPEEFQTGWQVGNYLPTQGDYDVKEAFLETAIPLGAGLEFNGAVRATDYSTSGYVTTWKVGGTWQPVDDILLRITRSRDIRAPNLNELFQAGTSRTNTLTDPFTGEQGVTFREQTTGNLNLRPEKADSLTAGVVLTPRFLPGFSLAVDYFDIEVEDAIGQLFAQDIINRCFEGRDEFCDAYGPDPTGDREFFFRASPFNFSEQKVKGIDIDASYSLPIDAWFDAGMDDSLIVRGLATRYIDNISDTGVNIPVDSVGALGSGVPKWLYRVSLTYDTPDFSITGVGRGASSGTYSNSYIECAPGDCPVGRDSSIVTQFPTIDDNSIPGVFYADLNFAAKFDTFGNEGSEFFVQISNLFDEDPILLPEGGLSANSTYSDLLGRQFRVGVRMRLW